MPSPAPPLALVLCPLAAVAACNAANARSPPHDAEQTAARATADPPARWFGARSTVGALTLTVSTTDLSPRLLAAERPGSRDASSVATDIAYDSSTHVVYVATCCEPGSGSLWALDEAGSRGFRQHDQGFAVDTVEATRTIARSDPYGTLGIRTASATTEELRIEAGVADVAVNAADEPRVLALVEPARLRALIPTVAMGDPALLVLRPKAGGGWQDEATSLPRDGHWCRVVSLKNGAVGLLAGTPSPSNPVECTGDRVDVLDRTSAQLRRDVLRLPASVRHISTDGSGEFLIFTTVKGAVGWRTLDGRGGSLTQTGFAAADW